MGFVQCPAMLHFSVPFKICYYFMSVPTYSNDWRVLQKFALFFPDNFYIINAVAEGLYAEGNYTSALKYYKKALQAHPEAHMDWGHVGYAFEEGDKNYKRAIRYFEKALDELVGKHDTWLMQRLGWCCIQDKQFERSLDIFLEQCHQVPTDAWSHGKVGYCYQMLGNYQSALTYHLRADQLGTTEYGWNLGNIGYCYQMTGDYTTALDYHLRAEQYDSSDLWNLKNVGYCYQKASNYTDALAYHQRVYDEDPTDVWNVKNVGYCHQQHGNYEKALKYHYLVEKMSPEDTWNLGHIGYCLQRLDRHHEAIAYHQKVYDLAPEDTWNKYQLGYCYFTQYDLEGAEFYLQGDDDKYALLHLGSVHLIKGETYKALELYKDSLRMFGSITSFLDVFAKDRVYLEGEYGVSAMRCEDVIASIETYSLNQDDWDIE